MHKISAVIVAGGSSARMDGVDKLLLKIGSKTVIERSAEAFENNALISEIIIVASESAADEFLRICGRLSKLKAVVCGGNTRTKSVRCGIDACSADVEYIAIHDGARPFVSAALITRTIKCAIDYGAAAPGVKVIDTIKRVDGDCTIIGTPNRDELVAISTPQVFEAVLFRAAIKGVDDSFDDCQLLERMGRKVRVVEGDRNNIKITERCDIARARQIAGESDMRIGHGYDVHRLALGRRLILGGVEIPHETGLLGHSDADVLTHAIMDALLGAAGLGDIGLFFPDTDDEFKDISSLTLLKRVTDRVRQSGFSLGNIDATVLCQAPKLRPFIDSMREELARCCEIDIAQINIKATTEEGLGFTGDKSGIAAHAVALLNAQ
ncbi:MAG: 2-C-methyl-D-erythritol 2,4-cyclodiphosphate synthase [Oscillospiraceae bacterium]